jgi:hypothetical protein
LPSFRDPLSGPSSKAKLNLTPGKYPKENIQVKQYCQNHREFWDKLFKINSWLQLIKEQDNSDILRIWLYSRQFASETELWVMLYTYKFNPPTAKMYCFLTQVTWHFLKYAKIPRNDSSKLYSIYQPYTFTSLCSWAMLMRRLLILIWVSYKGGITLKPISKLKCSVFFCCISQNQM